MVYPRALYEIMDIVSDKTLRDAKNDPAAAGEIAN